MEVYEVLCEGVAEARVFRFANLDDAIREAQRLCDKFKTTVRVVKVIGMYVPESRWVSVSLNSDRFQ